MTRDEKIRWRAEVEYGFAVWGWRRAAERGEEQRQAFETFAMEWVAPWGPYTANLSIFDDDYPPTVLFLNDSGSVYLETLPEIFDMIMQITVYYRPSHARVE